MAKKVLIIGGGPGGYVAAIRAAQNGAAVTLVEDRDLGGTCLNRGCIPTKALLKSVHVLHDFEAAGEYGLITQKPTVDYGKVFERKNKVITQLRNGIAGLLKASDVRIIKGKAKLESPNSVRVVFPDWSEHILKADAIILATGSIPSVPPLPGTELVMTSDELLEMKELPGSMVIVGGGVIGVEFATVFASFGVRVTIVELLDRLIGPFDQDLCAQALRSMQKIGVDVHLGTGVTAFEKDGDKVVTKVKLPDGKASSFTADKVLMCVGRKANIAGLGLEKAGVAFDRVITVNDRMETNVPGVYAIGDCNGGVQLAHIASREGEIAADNICGKKASHDYRCVPSCVFTAPEIASAGMTEAEARAAVKEVKIGRFPFNANVRALIENETDGFVKIIADAKNDRVLGVHIAGPSASSLIVEAVSCIEGKGTLSTFTQAVHSHPTVSEAVQEAALGANGVAIHMLNR